MPKHPLAEVFGFPVDNNGLEAKRYRDNRLCPYNNIGHLQDKLDTKLDAGAAPDTRTILGDALT